MLLGERHHLFLPLDAVYFQCVIPDLLPSTVRQISGHDSFGKRQVHLRWEASGGRMAARSSLLLSSLAQGLPIALFTFVLCFSVSVILLALMEPWVLRGWARRFLSPERTRPRDTRRARRVLMSVPREQQEEAPQKQGRSITHDRAEGTATRESSGGEWHCDADLGGRGHAQQSMNSTAEESPAAAGRIEHEDVQDQGAYDRIRVSTQHKDLSWTRPDCVNHSKFSRYLAAKAARAARAARNEREKRDGRQERGSAWQAMR